MREKNLFESVGEKLQRRVTIGAVLLLVGLLGLGLAIYLGQRSQQDAVPFTSLKHDQGKVVTLQLAWMDTAMAEGGDPERWYHFGQTTNHDLVVLALTKDRSERVNDLIAADPDGSAMVASPFAVTGLVERVPNKLRPYIMERYMAYGIKEQPRLSLTDDRANFMVSDGAVPNSLKWPYALLVPGIIGLVMLLSALANRRRLRISEQEMRAFYPAGFDLDTLVSSAQLHLPGPKLLVNEPLLISYQDTVRYTDLGQAGWMYAQHIQQRYGVQHLVQVHRLDKRVNNLPMKGKTKQLDQDLLPLWDYMAQHYPDVQLGYSKEQRKQFSQRVQ